jgi:DNA invertase Pin-like site-specific DNA recombinase
MRLSLDISNHRLRGRSSALRPSVQHSSVGKTRAGVHLSIRGNGNLSQSYRRRFINASIQVAGGVGSYTVARDAWHVTGAMRRNIGEANMPGQTRTAIYARVSTSNNGQDPQVQLRELREYVTARGWTLAGEYVDYLTGTKESRPQLNKLMADGQRRRFDLVLVWRFDRFARSVSHLLRALETFRALGIEFVSLCEQVDTTTPTGKMIFTVLGAVAELERSLIVERVRAGIRNAKAKGVRLGRPRVAVDRAKVAAMRQAGDSWDTIRLALGVGKGTAQRSLSASLTTDASALLST